MVTGYSPDRRRSSIAATLLVAAFILAGAGWRATQPATASGEAIEIFDAHLHYNWEPRPYLPLDEVVALFKRNRVTGILATSRPNDGTHALVGAKAEGLWVVPFIRPYRIRADLGTWFNDPKTMELIEAEHKRGSYRGIGEFHLTGKAAATEWVRKVVDFAVANDLYLHAHADAEALEILYAHNPKARVIWAHTGFSLEPSRVDALLQRYPDLWGELSYRGGIVDGQGRLTDEWRALFERHSNRFLVGSDTWIDQRWASYSEIIAGYRGWLAQLPPQAAAQIAHGNARRLFAGP